MVGESARAGLSAVLHRYGAAPRLTAQGNPPEPAPDEVLVAMRFAPINPADLLMIAGRYPHAEELPCVIGAEGVGEVIRVGAAVRRLRVGDRVLPLVRGNWCSWRVLQEDDLTLAPAGLPLEQAAMLRINASTAWRLLSGRGLAQGDIVIQNAARSSVARFVRLLAAERGIRVLNVVREPRAEDDRAAWLADGPDLAARARGLAADGRLRLALDCVAGVSTGRLAEALDPCGKLIVFGHLSGEPCHIPSTLLTSKRLSIEGFSLRPAEAEDAGAISTILAEMAQLLAEASRPAPVRDVFPLSDLERALGAARQAGVGRILLALTA